MQDISNYQDKSNGIPNIRKEKGRAYKLSFTWTNHSNRDVHSQSELLPQLNIKLVLHIPFQNERCRQIQETNRTTLTHTDL